MAHLLWVVQWWQLSSINSAAPIAASLAGRGHDVTFLSTRGARTSLEALGFAFEADRRLEPYDWSDETRMPAPLTRLTREYIQWVFDGMGKRVADMLEVTSEQRFDALVVDARFLGAELGAEKSGLPWISYVDYYWDGQQPYPARARAWWNSARVRFGLRADTCIDEAAGLLGLSPHMVVVLGLPGLTPKLSGMPNHIHQVGPVCWDPPATHPLPPWLASIGEGRPIILVSTSSCSLGDWGLAGLVSEAMAGDDTVIVATGPSVGSSEGGLTQNLYAAPYIPHSELLDKASLVVCSGGFQVTTRALSAGLPVVAVPRGVDGHLVGRALERSGAGICLSPLRLSHALVRGAVRRGLSDPALRQGAAAMRLSRPSGNSGVAAASLIDGFVADRAG